MRSSSPQRNQAGSVGLWVALIVTVLLLIGAAVFAVWAYQSRQDYKLHSDQKANAAAEQAKQVEAAAKEKEFVDRYKQPLTTYNGPSAFGSINLKYPKTWSGYVSVDTQGDPLVDGYWAPGVVPSTNDDAGSVFALRVQVTSMAYSDVMQQYQDNVQQGTSKVQPYRLPMVKSVVGSKVTGSLITGGGSDDVSGTMIVLPLRANTLEIWVTSDKYQHDLDKFILPNISFSP